MIYCLSFLSHLIFYPFISFGYILLAIINDILFLFFQSGLDFKVQDKDGMNPLKLVCLDAQGSKILQSKYFNLS